MEGVVGQAKQRGSKRERIDAAVEAAEKAERERQDRVAEEWRRLTPEQKAARLESAKMMATLLSMGSFSGRFRR